MIDMDSILLISVSIILSVFCTIVHILGIFCIFNFVLFLCVSQIYVCWEGLYCWLCFSV